MKIEHLQPGATVWSVGSIGVGNTTLRSVAVWPVKIISTDYAARTVVASWNHNSPGVFRENVWGKWRKDRPLLIKLGFNRYRLATREEVAAYKKTHL